MKTAVEWFAEMTSKLGYVSTDILEQAKEMEKEQICDAYYYGIDVDSFNIKSPYQAAEQYYNETFKSE